MEPELPYPKETYIIDGDVVHEYVIPESDKAKVLDELYPFEGVPTLDEKKFDLHEGRVFTVHEFKVVRHSDSNWLVSPYYFHSGGTVIDWMPPEWEHQ